MRLPDGKILRHTTGVPYDPAKAHDYYEKHKHLKGRKQGSAQPTTSSAPHKPSDAKAHQKAALQANIQELTNKLSLLMAKIRELEAKASSDNRKSKAKKERTAKDANSPKSAAEKAQAARDNKKYRDKHQQQIANKAKAASGGGSSSKSDGSSSAASITDLKTLATKVRGQIAVAKQKLAAL